MRFLLTLAALCYSVLVQAQLVPQPPAVAAKSWLLYDPAAAQVLASQNPDERADPASLTKLMTAYLSFSALKQKAISLAQTVPVSQRAWKAPGSRMFIEPQTPVTVEELLRGMIVQSGNDACIALAETISGSEEVFVQMMNREAQRLGLKNTHFTNSSGLTEPEHYATARDMALLAAALIRDHPEYYPMYSQKEYKYNKIAQPNRNRLLWLDPTVDGLKTGHTEAAGYCLVASSKRGPRRLISVVMGTASDSVRVNESQKLLNFGFQFYDTIHLYAKDQVVDDFPVFKGSANKVKGGFLTDLVLSLPKGQSDKLKASLVSQQPLLAPVTPGQPVGMLQLTLDGKAYADYQVVALEGVPPAGILGRMWDSARLWFR
jgi:D-alanyl-D-alanine carboxypeptidase (penicillin-binding protein 5/6)